jgi:carotenoid cleavage dioxygenase
VAGLANRHGWFAQSRSEAGGGIAHIDLAQGRRRLWALPEGDGISEPVFVPRGESEGDGWILAVAWRGEEAASDLVVLDALSVADGPVATVRLPNRVPVGFHGAWVPAA